MVNLNLPAVNLFEMRPANLRTDALRGARVALGNSRRVTCRISILIRLRHVKCEPGEDLNSVDLECCLGAFLGFDDIAAYW